MATIELLPDWYQVSPDPAWPPTGGTRIEVVADAFGGTGSFIKSANDAYAIQYGFEDSPADIVVVSQIDIKLEMQREGGGMSLDAQLNIDGVGQGVQNQVIGSGWQTYTFGAWAGAWNRDSLETSLVTLYTNGGGKGDLASIATVRLVPTYTVLTGSPIRDLYAGGLLSHDGGLHG